jgi:hypothetical protein
MNNTLQMLLNSDGVEESLKDLIKGKLAQRQQEITELKRYNKIIQDVDSQKDSIMQNEYLIRFELKRKEIDSLDKDINSLCFAFIRAITVNVDVQELKKHFKRNWDDILEQLSQVGIEQVVSMYIPLTNPKRLIRCPFHEDRTPSLKLYLDTNSWYCFGCCKGGASVNFVMEMENISFKEAAEKLLNI